MFERVSDGVYLKKESGRLTALSSQMPPQMYRILENKYSNLPIPSLILKRHPSQEEFIRVYDNLIVVVRK